MPISTTQDTSNLYPWTQKTLERDENGFLIGEVVTFDDGRILTKTVTDGVKTLVTWSDPNNATNWASISTTFNPTTGQKTAQTRTMDDGRIISTTFDVGVISERVITDVANEFNWLSTTSSYDAQGRISSSVVSHDDGRTSTTTYVNGVLDQRTVADTDGAFIWTSTVYDWNPVDGQLLTVTTTMDDGTIIVTGPALGPEESTVIRTDTKDKFLWESRETTYDAAGAIVQRTVEYDDGRIEVAEFTGGVRSETTISDVDDVKAWETVELTYDTKGQLTDRTTIYDDDRVVTSTYQDGVLATRTVVDVLDAYNWLGFSLRFDAKGRLVEKIIGFDDGVVKTTAYRDGVIFGSIKFDYEDVHAWESISTAYGLGGSEFATLTVMDDGSRIYTDPRGLEIITGGTQASAVEDQSSTLTTSGAITFVDGFRQETAFDAQTVVGTNAYGTFTLLADGTWTYAALNAQTDIQALGVGDTLTDSFTALSVQGIEVVVTVTIEGRTDSAPLFMSDTEIVIGGAGNLVTAAPVLDVLSLFTNDNNPFSYIGGTTGSAFFTPDFVLDTLSLSDFNNLDTVGDHSWTFIVQNDDLSETTTGTVTLTVAMNHDFGVDYDGSTNALGSVITGSSAQDTILFGDNAIGVTLNTLAGDDAITFGSRAGNSVQAIDVFSGEGDDVITFGTEAGYNAGQIQIDAGTGNDTITFGDNAGKDAIAAPGFDDGLISIVAGDGTDTITFGTLGLGARLSVDAGAGDDHVTIGFSTSGTNDATVIGGLGDDSLTFGDNFGTGGDSEVSGGDGNDTLTFGHGVGRFANFDVTGGDGDDIITFGVAAGQSAGTFNVFGGDGNDDITFGDHAAAGASAFNVNGGSGNNTITFGDITTGSLPGNVSITAGDGDDTIVTGLSLNQEVSNSLRIDTGDGTNSVTIGDNQEELTVTGGSGVDTISVGANTGSTSHVTVIDGGGGSDVISIGENSSFLSVVGGAGDDVISVADRSTAQTTNVQFSVVYAGVGADTITIGTTGFTQIFLGQDTDQDSLTFTGGFRGLTIYDWTTHDAPVTFENSGTVVWYEARYLPSGWPALVLVNDAGQSITFDGAAGADPDLLVSGLNLFDNSAPVALDPNPGFGEVGVGNLSSPYSLDLQTLFSDADTGTVNFETMTVTATGLPTGWTLTNSVLQRDAETSIATLGTHEITLTATDASGASGQITLDLVIAHEHDFGDNFGRLSSAGTTVGSIGDDTLVFGANTGRSDRGFVQVDTYAGEDTLTFGASAATNEGTLIVNSGDDDDSITFGDRAAQGDGNLTVNSGSGNDIVEFGDFAGEFNPFAMRINTGTGDDIVIFGIEAGNEAADFKIDLGLGADRVIFDENAGRITVDLGLDSDVDTLIFAGTFSEGITDITIENWVSGIDLIDVDDSLLWLIHDDGTDTTLSNGTSDLTFIGITGLTDVDDFLI